MKLIAFKTTLNTFKVSRQNKVENLACCTSKVSITSAHKGVEGGKGLHFKKVNEAQRRDYRVLLAP